MNNEQLESFVKGAIIGHLIGDALGHPYSHLGETPSEPEMIVGPSGERPGAYQAPGALSLCTMANVSEFNGIQTHDLMEKFHDFLIAGYMAPFANIDECSDISPVTVEAIKKFTNGMPPDRCGNKKENDNECLTRMLPIGLWYAKEPIDSLINATDKVCEITHGRIEDKVTCAAYVLLIRNILLQYSEKVFDFLEDYYKTIKRDQFVEAVRNLKNWRTTQPVNGGKEVENCFWSAWKAHSVYERDFRFCVYSAIQMGNDTNATASVAGSLSGLTNGLEDIPSPWLRTISLTTEVMETVQQFTNKVVARLQA